MTMRRKWAVIPGLLALAATAVVLSAYSGASTPQGRSPVQPIRFPHPRHAGPIDTKNPGTGGLNLNCLYCHFSANESPDPGLPAVQTCMGCHTIVGAGGQLMALPGRPARKSPELAKLQSYWNASDPAKSKPVPWVRIHKVPEYVHFPHMRHVNAGVTCQDCHGQVQEMNQVYQAQSLNMGWCINCHLGNYKPQYKARYDCSVCHY